MLPRVPFAMRKGGGLSLTLSWWWALQNLESKVVKSGSQVPPRCYSPLGSRLRGNDGVVLEGDFAFGFYFGLVDFVAEAGFVGDG